MLASAVLAYMVLKREKATVEINTAVNKMFDK